MMSEVDLKDYEGMLAELYPVSYRISHRLYGCKDFKQLRQDFSAFVRSPKTCSVVFLPNEIAHMHILREYEQLFCHQYDASTKALITQTFMMLAAHMDDVMQDCRMLVIQNIWEYDGRAGLHTFMHRSLYNFLQSLIRKYEMINGPSKTVSHQINQVYKLMQSDDISYEEAVVKMAKPNLKKYRNARKMRQDFDDHIHDLEQTSSHSEEFHEDWNLLQEALKTIEFSEVQRAALEAVLSGDSLASAAKLRGFTRSHMSAEYNKALQMLRKYMVAA